MNFNIKQKIIPVTLTVLMSLAALLVLRHLWRFYMDDPWTRDAHINADVIQVAPDVSGLVSEVKVHDNAPVHRGDVLFVVDQRRYRLALEQAQAELKRSDAAVEQAQAALAQSQIEASQLEHEIARDRALKDLIAAEESENRRAKLARALSHIAAGQAAVKAA